MLVTRGLGGRSGLVAFGFGANLVIRWPSVEPGVVAVVNGVSRRADVVGSGPTAECAGTYRAAVDVGGLVCTSSHGRSACATSSPGAEYSVSS